MTNGLFATLLSLSGAVRRLLRPYGEAHRVEGPQAAERSARGDTLIGGNGFRTVVRTIGVQGRL